MSASSDACVRACLASTSARVRSLPERFVSGCFFSWRLLLKLSEVRQFVQPPSLHSHPPEREIKSRMMAYQPIVWFCLNHTAAARRGWWWWCRRLSPRGVTEIRLTPTTISASAAKKVEPGIFFFLLSRFLKLWKLLTRAKIHIYFIKWMWIYLKPIHK